MRAPLTSIRSRYAVLAPADIDTDRIIPARFLTTVTREGLGRFAFHDWRFRADGAADDTSPLNAPGVAGARVLVVGRNFGCGSSREHAVWALMDLGFSAIVCEKFADIFRANAMTNGLVPVEVDARVIAGLVECANRSPGAELTIDVGAGTVVLPDGGTSTFALPPFARHCIMHGVDELEFLRRAEDDIADFEKDRDINMVPR